MSYVVDNAGDRYRGGYASSSNFVPEELRVATSTFENYIGGTVLIVVAIFGAFLALSAFVFLLMCYARYMKLRRHKGGFYDPPPMVSRLPANNRGGRNGAASSAYGTASRPSMHDYASLQRKNAPSQLSQAHSQQSEML